MNKYRRIEVNAFRRRVTIVSGEWPSPEEFTPRFQTGDTNAVSLNDAENCEPVEPASPEGQQILVEAVRSLERRLSPEALEAVRCGRTVVIPAEQNRKGFSRLISCFYQYFIPRNKIPF